MAVASDLAAELWRYYGVAVLNTGFGYGLYAGLVWVGLNLFAAQICSRICGVAFNYFMFRRLVFRGAKPKIIQYIGAYAFNYLVALTCLAGLHQILSSPYIAGFLAMIFASLINYLILRSFVFNRRVSQG